MTENAQGSVSANVKRWIGSLDVRSEIRDRWCMDNVHARQHRRKLFQGEGEAAGIVAYAAVLLSSDNMLLHSLATRWPASE